jgi:16S rRNA (guanine966-N2)-methyltransferase
VVSGARVADLFAGSGALGLEALSRGAAFCLFVEKNRSALKALEDNLAALAVGEQAQVLAVDAIRSQRLKEHGPFGLILADPPYDKGLVKRVVEAVVRPEIMAPGGWLVVEHSPRERPVEAGQARLSDHRVYGQTELSFLQYPDMRKALT